jgi:cyclophilin family peptidyl-prolyl cis-trans isomerase
VSRIPSCLIVCWLGMVLASPAVGAEPETAPEIETELPLEVGVAALQPVTATDGPLWLRFTLTNRSSEPVNLTVAGGDVAGGAGLPLELIFGPEAEPAISLQWSDEPAQRLSRPAADEDADDSAPEPGTLRLAPYGMLGRLVDLREYERMARYAGPYRLVWRPLDGRFGEVACGFRVEPRKEAILVTDYGKITVELDYNGAPRNVANFIELAREDFYDGTTFHRVIPGFLVQGGCPQGTGTGQRPDGVTVPAEFRDVPFRFGTVAMARKPSDPNSASCQFFIALGRAEKLDGEYTVIGQAVGEESIRTLHQLGGVATNANDRPLDPIVIRSVSLVDVDPEPTIRLELNRGRGGATPSTETVPPGGAPSE